MEPNGAKSQQAGGLYVLVGLLIALSGLVFWWAWRQGAYFGPVFYPGAIGVLLLLALLALFAPFEGRLRGPALVALGALVAIAAWTALSMLWTPTRGSAAAYAEHAFLYVALFIVGLWICTALARRPALALLPLAVGGSAVAVAVVLTLANGHDLAVYFHGEATLRLPLGYRNANAAFFLICTWPALALAADRGTHPALRVASFGGATAMLEIALLCQSRGSVPAALIAAIAFIAFSPSRLRAAAYLALVAIPVAIASPTLLEVFQHNELKGLLPYMHRSAGMIAITVALSVVLAAVVVAWLDPRAHLEEQTQRRLGWGLGLTAGAVALVGLVAFLAHEGGPVNFVDQRVDQFTAGGITDFSSSEARFGVNVGSNRDDFWRVSLDQAKETPVLGEGAGSFALSYLLHRRSPETPRDPHSVEALMLDELGIPGLLLFAAFVIATLAAAVVSRRAGPAAATAVAGGATSLVYWTLHASYDWLWNYPVVTGAMAFLAGVAVAPGVRALGGRMGRGPRLAIAAVATLVALSAVPLFLSERYVGRAVGEEGADPAGAYEDYDNAADLNPWDPSPLIDKGLLAASEGQTALAVKAFREAESREPDNYAPHLFLAEELAATDPAAARRQIAEALRLNPYEGSIKAASKQIDSGAKDAKQSEGKGSK